MTDKGLLGASAVMAVGTVFSRLSGLIRSVLLAAALGTQLHADLFNIANTIPNMLYILLAGGVFNAVLVPQLVRAMKADADGGAAYTSRLITVAGLFLAGVSAVLVLCAPLLMRLFLDPSFFASPDLAAQRDSAIVFARYCLPQVFFYGMFVLVGQVLNARGVFGPMMWAPIANNVIAIGTLGLYLLTFGGAYDVCADPSAVVPATQSVLGPYSPGQQALLGVGSTLGIALQFLILLPYLRRAGFRFEPRLDLRGSGLGHTMRLGVWTVLFVIVNQIAYTIVVRLASSGTAQALGHCATQGTATGYTVYSTAFLIAMVPHSVATVSLATAVLPRLSAHAAADDLGALAKTLSAAMRSAYAVIIPFAALLPVVVYDLVRLGFGYGAARSSYTLFAPSLIVFGLALVFFTGHYLMLRGFYAMEQTRRVFLIQCAVAATNVAMAWLLTRQIDPVDTAPRLAIAYACAYAVGALVSYALLSRRVGGLNGAGLVRYGLRVLAAAVGAAAVAWGAMTLVHNWSSFGPWLTSAVALGTAGLLGLATYVGLARLLNLSEVTELTSLITSRIPGRR